MKKNQNNNVVSIASLIKNYEDVIKELEHKIWLQRQGQSLLKIENLEEKIKDQDKLIFHLATALEWISSEFEFLDECGCLKDNSNNIESLCPFHLAMIYCTKILDNNKDQQ